MVAHRRTLFIAGEALACSASARLVRRCLVPRLTIALTETTVVVDRDRHDASSRA
jgi:hypothetical protein